MVTNRKFSIFKVLTFLFITGALTALISCKDTHSHGHKDKNQQATFVETADVEMQNWQKQMQATGTLIANQGIVVKSEVAGRITKIMFQSGAYVTRGTRLVELNQDLLKAELASATAKLGLSKAMFGRLSDLFKTKVVSKSDLDKAQADFTSDKANVALTQAKLAQTLIVAPFSGHLGLNLVNLGDYLAQGQDIVNLQDDNVMRVDFSVPEIYLADLAVGEKIMLQSKAFSQQKFAGKVFAIDSVVDQSTRSINVRATIPNQQHTLIPGTFVEVTLYMGNKSKVMTIPQSAVIYAPSSNYVYIVQDNKAIQTNVVLGQRRGDNVEIVDGLNANDKVVTSGQLKLANGMSVKSSPRSLAEG